MTIEERKAELPSREEIIKMCREVRRDVYKREVEPLSLIHI
mgnify:CR=1 FL=1